MIRLSKAFRKQRSKNIGDMCNFLHFIILLDELNKFRCKLVLSKPLKTTTVS